MNLAFSGDFVPLDKVTCVGADSAPLGDLLVTLLGGAAVKPVALGPNHVVLAPEPGRHADLTHAGVSVGLLDRVVVTGSANGASQRALTIAMDEVRGRELAAQGTSALASALDGAVPGIWAWQQSPSSLVTAFASVRGASSFGVSTPKVYVDGIEVANPLLFTRFNAEAIDRIEVIRGPQGAALYGADAISGVINVVTRHEGAGAEGSRGSLHVAEGVASSQFVSRDPMADDIALSLRAGSSARSAGLDVWTGGMGDYIARGSSRTITATGNARLVGPQWTLMGTARVFNSSAGNPTSPLLASTVPPPPTTPSGTTTDRQSLDQYTLGGTASYAASERWTHSLLLGVDGYRLSNLATNFTPIPSAADSALRASRGTARRGTIRATSVVRLGIGDGDEATLTFAAEHSGLLQETFQRAVVSGAQRGPGMPQLRTPFRQTQGTPPPLLTVSSWNSNSGLVAQGSGSWDGTFFLTGGARVEQNDGFVSSNHAEFLPMLGAAWVREVGGLTVKARAAYGKGIRPAQSPSHSAFWQSAAEKSSLRPEVQSGVEAGIDLLWGRVATLQLTRFDQKATDLVQQVAVAADTQPLGTRINYTLQNVGEISNRGWELSGTAHLDALTLNATLSAVESRVEQLARGYTGDLRPGDRMLLVPSTTMSLTASWTANRWWASVTASRARDWVNYDQIALARDFAQERRPAHELVGALLRNYWIDYDGVTRLRATFSRDLWRGLSVDVTGENLLDRQSGEPDNATVLPGRLLMLGLRARF